MARIASTALFTSLDMSINSSLLARYSEPDLPNDWIKHVISTYSLAFKFCLNDFYVRDIEIEYLLGRNITASETLGSTWSDWVRVRNHRLGTDSIHISFCFSAPVPDADDEKCSVVEAAAKFIDMVYKLPEEPRAIDPALLVLGTDMHRIYTKRKNALGLSRYAYTSLYGLGEVASRDACAGGLLTNYYRLLFLHARGADAKSAEQQLGPPWRSTSFFELYCQPGGILSASTPYPTVDYEKNVNWFQPNPPHNWRPHEDDFVGLKYENYDLLPEYPPLRYLALPCLEYAAIFEETLRASQESTFESAMTNTGSFRFTKRQAFRVLNILVLPFRFAWHVFKNHRAKHLRTHLLAASLEGIRLPIVRRFVASMFDNAHQERTVTAVMTWTTRRLAVVASLLAVIALVATLTFRYFDMSQQRSTDNVPSTLER